MTIGLFPGELAPSTTLGGCIEIFENAWPNPEATIAAVEQQCDNKETEVCFQRATTVGSGAFQNARTNLDMSVSFLAQITGNQLMKDIHNQMYFLLLAASLPYANRHGIEEVLYHEPYNLLKYKSGQEYKTHYDGSTGMGRAL